MLEVGWTQRGSNVNILDTFGSRRELMAVVRRRQITFMGHMMRAKGRLAEPNEVRIWWSNKAADSEYDERLRAAEVHNRHCFQWHATSVSHALVILITYLQMTFCF